MKVDSKGQPVAEGTFGLWGGMSAKVVRTFIDPTKDTESTQAVIADGGYFVDVGEKYGVQLTYPSDFTATYDGVNVKAQDGQLVEVGDKVMLDPGAESHEFRGKPMTVRTLYPIGTLKDTWCASMKEVEGMAPDKHWGVSWGAILKVVEKSGVKVSDESHDIIVTLLDPAIVKEGDWLKFLADDHRTITSGLVLIPAENGHHLMRLDRDHVEDDGDGPYYDISDTYTINTGVTLRRIAKSDLKGFKTKDGSYAYVGDVVKVGFKDCKGTWEVISSNDGGTSTVFLKPLDDISKKLDDEYHKPKGAAIRKSPGVMFYGVGYITEIVSRAADKDADDFESGISEGNHGYYTNEDEETDYQNEESDRMSPEPHNKEKSVGKVDVVRDGTIITLPEKMTLRTAIKELQRQAEQEEMDVNIMEIIPGFPLDAAHAFVQALAKKFGWVNALPTPGFFGPQPPTMIGVVVDPSGRTVQIPWGQIGVPGISGTLATGIQFQDNKPYFCIQGTIKQRDKVVVNEIALLTKEYLKENSIYKGKAIRVKFPTDAKKFSPLDNQPKFIQTTDVRPDELIFSEGVAKQISVNIWTPIRALAAVKAAKVPLKRGVLLFGTYGVGKTLLASVTARMSVEAGITFIDLEDSNQLPQAVEFGRALGGMVCIFAEDIDRCDENGTRSDAFNNILNTVDGLTSKTDEVMIVYTTNHIERINKAMLRQGRIDKVIHIKAPDEVAAQKLVRLYARHMLKAEEDLTEVGRILAGFIPAAIREVVEQSKLAAIERGDFHNITADDLKVTAENTKEHMELLKDAPKDDRSDLEKLGDALGNRVGGAIVEIVNLALENDDDIDTSVKAGVEKTVAQATRRRKAA